MKIVGDCFVFARFSDQNMDLFLGPFFLLNSGPEKAKHDYWPSLFPGQFSNPNVAPFLGPFLAPVQNGGNSVCSSNGKRFHPIG